MAGGRPVHTVDRTLSGRQLAALITGLPDTRLGYRELARAVRSLVLNGRIALHMRLPAERELASALGVSRATVTAAYDLLRESGYAHSRRGAGTWTSLPDGQRPTSIASLPSDEQATIDLGLASPAAPEGAVAEALTQAAAQLPRHTVAPGYHPYGLPDLRAAVADRFTRRGLPTLPDQILITSGAQHALALVLALLGRPGDRVMAENPSYTNGLDALRRARLRIASVPVTETGWDTDLIESTLRQTTPRLAYLIPDFHNPTGNLMPDEQRVDVLRAARHTDTWLVIDETIADIALDVPPPAPFASLAHPSQGGQVITIGSLSKSCWGGLRVGWVRTTSQLATELAALRMTVDMAGSVLDQLVALALLDRLDDVLPRRRERLRTQRDALAAALNRHLPEWVWSVPRGGLSLWVDLGHPGASDLADRALGYGIRIEGGARFGVDPGTHEHRLRLPYTLPTHVYDKAAERLAAALEGVPSHTTPAGRTHWVA
ncbi:PLP-dependent aminotransferase family protein [Streptomyces sp. LX-29]|nr:PLP-dependent aminotransferase family protein [Streptomyces sp. LX-29]WFB06280.1 PLP-dependent aminotransferase family protein [Streptomyces sp. LX-29]